MLNNNNEVAVDTADFRMVKGVKHMKVKGPYWKEHVMTGTCPYCGFLVSRIWNSDYCGCCGKPITWKGIYVDNWGPLL